MPGFFCPACSFITFNWRRRWEKQPVRYFAIITTLVETILVPTDLPFHFSSPHHIPSPSQYPQSSESTLLLNGSMWIWSFAQRHPWIIERKNKHKLAIWNQASLNFLAFSYSYLPPLVEFKISAHSLLSQRNQRGQGTMTFQSAERHWLELANPNSSPRHLATQKRPKSTPNNNNNRGGRRQERIHMLYKIHTNSWTEKAWSWVLTSPSSSSSSSSSETAGT